MTSFLKKRDRTVITELTMKRPVNVFCSTGDEIRLVGGSSSLEGNVEVRHEGEWGAVCHHAWDITDADVTCRQLGYRWVLWSMHCTVILNDRTSRNV